MTSVLLVDDEPGLLRAMALNLGERGYQVTTAATGRGALDSVTAHTPDVVVLDLGLPDIDGLRVISELLTRHPALPIVVLSARTASNDKVLALDLGAIDYVTKPFDVNELLARLRAATRRIAHDRSPATVVLGDVTVDLEAYTLRRGTNSDEAIHLTPTEWRMLETLLRQPNKLVTTREMLTALRGGTENTDSSYLRIYIAQLRRKIESVPSRPRYLLTEPGMGYRYVP